MSMRNIIGLTKVFEYYQKNTNIKLPPDLMNEIDIYSKKYGQFDIDQSSQVYLNRVLFN